METDRSDDPVAEAIFLALFKLTTVADLEGDERAVNWAREALDNRALDNSLAEGVRRAVAERAETGE